MLQGPGNCDSRGGEALTYFGFRISDVRLERTNNLTAAATGNHQLTGKPVDQFRVRRRRSLRAKVILRLHEAASEILLPDTIHRDASGKRVVGIHEPSGEIEAIGVGSSAEGMKNPGHAGLHDGRRAGEVALGE